MSDLGAIQTRSPKPNLEKVRFSFEHLQVHHAKFNLEGCTKEYYDALFREIIRYQQLTVHDFTHDGHEGHRHPLTFKETTEPDGFPGIDPSDEDLWTDGPWQFGLPGVKGSPSGLWRVHGFLSGRDFYIVWLDPNHVLHPKNVA